MRAWRDLKRRRDDHTSNTPIADYFCRKKNTSERGMPKRETPIADYFRRKQSVVEEEVVDEEGVESMDIEGEGESTGIEREIESVDIELDVLEKTRTCSNKWHSTDAYKPLYPRDAVPESQFLRIKTDPNSATKMCENCRMVGRIKDRKRYEKRMELKNQRIAAEMAKKAVPVVPPADDGPEKTRRCACKTHKRNGSQYDREEVPESQFAAVKGDNDRSLEKLCNFCRKAGRATRDRRRDRQSKKEISESQVMCAMCCNIVEKADLGVCLNGDIATTCKACYDASALRNIRVRLAKREAKISAVVARGFSCEICHIILLKPPIAGSTVIVQVDIVDGYVTYNGVTLAVNDFLEQNRNDLETRTLENDHIPKAEYEARYPGRTHVPKRARGLNASMGVYNREIGKCQALCTYCHLRVTQERYTKNPNYGSHRGGTHLKDGRRVTTILQRAKQDTIDRWKRAIGKCEFCACWHPDLLSIMEADHRDPVTKRDALAMMAKKKQYSVADVEHELTLCRLLCRDCHRIQTSLQLEAGVIQRARDIKKNARIEAVTK